MNVNTEKSYKRGSKAKAHTVVDTKPMSYKTIDISNHKFGRLYVLEYLGVNKGRSAIWKSWWNAFYNNLGEDNPNA